MTYQLPEWGIWSGARMEMLEAGFTDLDEAKKRIWNYFDAGDESVTVAPSCPQHPERLLTTTHRQKIATCRKRLDGDIDHAEESQR